MSTLAPLPAAYRAALGQAVESAARGPRRSVRRPAARRVEPLGGYPIVAPSPDEAFHGPWYARAFARELGIDTPEVRWFKAPDWAHAGAWSPEAPGVVYVRAGLTLTEALAKVAHECAHAAGGDEAAALRFETRRTRQLIERFGNDARPLDGSAERLNRAWCRVLVADGIEVIE